MSNGIKYTFIGDGVYVGFDGLHIVLTTHIPGDAFSEEDSTIYLETSVFKGLTDYVLQLAFSQKG